VASRFEDLRAWQAGRQLTTAVYRIIRCQPFARDFALSDQIRRASLSTMNNIAEGFDSGSALEFARFLRYASRSASEVQSCLYVALDQGYLSRSDFGQAYNQAENVRRLCGALCKALRVRCPRRAARPDRVSEPQAPLYGTDAKDCMRVVVRPATGHRPPATPFPQAG
jgi:four helix bundle protein